MASSLLKKVRIRAARCCDQLLQLRAECTTPDDAQRLEQCIAAMREASGRMDDVFHDYKPAVAPRRQKPLSTPAPLPPSNPGKPPVYGPETGIYAAPAGQQGKTWQTRTVLEREEDQPMVLPDNMTDAEFVKFCLLEQTSAYEIEAAKQLAAMSGWAALTAEKQASAIRTAAAELERDDVSDDDPLIVKPETLAALVPEMNPNNVVF